MDSDEAASLLNDLGKLKHDDFIVAKVRRTSMDEHLREVMIVPECYRCETQINDGDIVFVWGRPLGSTPQEVHAASHAGLLQFCSDDCLDLAIQEWCDEIGFEQVAVGYYG